MHIKRNFIYKPFNSRLPIYNMYLFSLLYLKSSLREFYISYLNLMK